MYKRQSGNRVKEPILVEVANKTINLFTGETELDLINTSFGLNTRYGLISPSSKIAHGLSNTQFIIKESYGKVSNEWQKWKDLIGANVKVRDKDWTLVGTGKLQKVEANRITVDSDLGFIPTLDMVMTLDSYDSQSPEIKLVYAFMNKADFADGKPPYQIL